MTLVKRYFIVCDECAATGSTDVQAASGRSATASRDARAEARRRGWRRRDRRDLCPRCRPGGR